MAAPSYTEDLSDITLAETTTGWTALGGGASGLGTGSDFSMEGTLCVDKQVTAAEKGQIFNFGSGITPGTNTHFYVWVFLATPGLANTLANRGLGIVIGTATTAYNTFHVEGSDTYGASGRVGKCYPIRYVTTSNGSAPYRTLTGSPTANPQYFGATANITGTVKGANLGVDAIRYGTGAYITAGESGNPATFSGFAAVNDASTNRWGILSSIGGGFELQGRFVVGQNNAGTPTLAYFSDSNRIISFVDTVHSLTDFTQIIVDHASTEFYLTNCTFQALGTHNPGQLVFNNASTISTLTSCTFSGMGISTLRAGVTATSCTWRQAGQITTNGATLTGCTISNNTASSAVLAASPANAALISGTNFTSDGTGHAIEVTGTAADFTLTNNTYTGYASSNGSTGNEVIYVNIATGTMTISISGGSTPSIRTAGATVTVQNAVTVKVTAKDANTLAAIQDARVLLEAAAGGDLPAAESVTITRSGSTASVAHTSHGMATGMSVIIRGATEDEYNGIYTISNVTTNAYDYTVSGTPATPATGTITATCAILSGVTNASGILQTTAFNYTSNQPITGKVRRATTGTKYKTGAITGTITSAGLDTTILLISDE